MYQPVHFREDRIEVQHDLIRTNPLGLVITAGPRGLLASPLPFLVDSDAAQKERLSCHKARANPHWKELNVVDQCLVVFQGPSDYVSPSWYPSKIETGKVVPTWNYATVHVWGKPQVTEDEAWLRRRPGVIRQPRRILRHQADYAQPTADFAAAVGLSVLAGAESRDRHFPCAAHRRGRLPANPAADQPGADVGCGSHALRSRVSRCSRISGHYSARDGESGRRQG
jgi:transcriptional regulator